MNNLRRTAIGIATVLACSTTSLIMTTGTSLAGPTSSSSTPAKPSLTSIAASPAAQVESAGLSKPAAVTTTKTVTRTNSYKSLAGIVVVKHYGYTTWSYKSSKLVTPKSVSSSYWTAVLNYCDSQGASWDWYNSTSGRSNIWAKFVFGIPTPWGPVGSTLMDRQITAVYGTGSYQIVS